LKQTYRSTLTALETIPSASSYRQATEGITLARLKAAESAGDNIQQVEQTIGGGQIEEILNAAQDELNLVAKMKLVEPYVGLIYPNICSPGTL
jgi:NADH dehydrogenase (ubiquinone) 1 alpha subcomplex subunit 5